MSILYTKTTPSSLPSNYKTAGRLARQLKPNGNGVIDVVNNFNWTLTPTTSRARKEAPVIFLREFYRLESQINQSLLPYGTSIGSTDFNNTDFGVGKFINFISNIGVIRSKTKYVYDGLYDHNFPTNFIYRLPYFTKESFTINNTWQQVDILDKIIDLQEKAGGVTTGIVSSALKGIGSSFKDLDIISKLPRLLKNIEIFNLKSQNPTVGLMDPPSVWQSTTPRTYTFEFPLYNTTGNTNDIIKNWEMCYMLTYQNLVNKKNFYTGIPPVFYEVTIPGVHYCKASYINNITISNIGNIRKLRLTLDGNITDANIPDAYLISITLTDLLMPSKNLLSVAINTPTVTTQ